MAASNAAFLAFTSANAFATALSVTFSSLITASASVTALAAAVFASLYASTVAFVLPSVGTTSFAFVSKSALAADNSAVSALATNFALAASSLAFKASIFDCTSAASACVLFSGSAKIASASLLAAAISSVRFPVSAL